MQIVLGTTEQVSMPEEKVLKFDKVREQPREGDEGRVEVLRTTIPIQIPTIAEKTSWLMYKIFCFLRKCFSI